MMKYKGYFAEPYYSQEDGCFIGQLLGIEDIVSFEGETVKDIEENFKEAVDDYIEMCKQVGEKPQKPFSGKFMIRLEPELHARLMVQASKKNKSLNQYINEIILRAVS